MSFDIRCKVCNSMRPVEIIMAVSCDVSKAEGLPIGTVVANFQYCGDRQACIDVAMTWRRKNDESKRQDHPG